MAYKREGARCWTLDIVRNAIYPNPPPRDRPGPTTPKSPRGYKELVHANQMDPASFFGTITTCCHIIGFGKYEFLDSRYERDSDDFSRLRITRPFSVPEAAGAIAGVA